MKFLKKMNLFLAKLPQPYFYKIKLFTKMLNKMKKSFLDNIPLMKKVNPS